MKLSFYDNLRNYYHNNHYIRDSFHDHDHFLVLIHIHEFMTILQSLQRMVQIQLDETSDFSSKAHYFVQQQEDMILIWSKYFVNLRSWYYCCTSTFKAWNVVKKIFFRFFSPHNFNWELILKSAKLYSLIVLKSYNLKCIQSYRAFGRITIFWWSHLFFKLLHRVKASFTIRYSFFKTIIEMMAKENQLFCMILQGWLISFFNCSSKIHCIKMYFSIKDLR